MAFSGCKGGEMRNISLQPIHFAMADRLINRWRVRHGGNCYSFRHGIYWITNRGEDQDMLLTRYHITKRLATMIHWLRKHYKKDNGV